MLTSRDKREDHNFLFPFLFFFSVLFFLSIPWPCILKRAIYLHTLSHFKTTAAVGDSRSHHGNRKQKIERKKKKSICLGFKFSDLQGTYPIEIMSSQLELNDDHKVMSLTNYQTALLCGDEGILELANRINRIRRHGRQKNQLNSMHGSQNIEVPMHEKERS